MNRRDFLKLAITALLAACTPKGKLTMLPNQTNRYGDMLKDILSGVQGVDQNKVDSLQREMNELWQRENKYRSWLRLQDNKIDTKNLSLPFEPIYSIVLEDDKSDLSVPIPSQYKHLMAIGNGRVTGAGGNGYFFGQFNDDASSIYFTNALHQSGASVTGSSTTQTSLYIAEATSDSSPSGYGTSFVLYIPHYSSDFHKTVLSMSHIKYKSGGTDFAKSELWFSSWANTSPINKITFLPDANSLKNGSVFSVYGIF